MPLQEKNDLAKDFALVEQYLSQLSRSASSQDRDATEEDIALGEQYAEESEPSTSFASGLGKKRQRSNRGGHCSWRAACSGK